MFEFDSEKSSSNKLKHGIGFDGVIALWNDADRIEIPAKYVDELRFLLIAKIDSTYWSAIFTKRGENTRIISVRKSRKYEKEIYNSF